MRTLPARRRTAAVSALVAALTAVLAVLLAGVLLVVGLAAPSEAASGRCAKGTGVTVVVDYGPLGGGVVLACDPDGAGRAASEVMARTGFDLTYVNNQPGFVCRIQGKPDESQESCGQTPPADAYWGLFWSDGDPATWRYSSQGAGSLDVPEGGSIGWRFQDGGDREDPGAPPTAAATTPSPQPSSQPSSQPTRSPSPHPTKTPTAQPSGPSEAAEPTPTQEPSASVPAGAGGAGDKATGRSGRKQTPGAGKGGAGKSGNSGNSGKDGKSGKHGKAKRDRRDDRAVAGGVTASPSPTVAALEPASTEPVTGDGSSTGLTAVAGLAVLALAAAAGVVAWRRRA